MTIKKINLEQGTPEWLAYRVNGIGGSDIASIHGSEGAFKKRGEVMMEKLGHTKELTEYQKGIFAAGHEWEAVVRDRLNGQGFNFQPAVIESGINARFFASLDGLDADRELLLEVKSCTTVQKFAAYVESTPDHYFAQVQWQMAVTGYSTTWLAFVHNGELSVKEVKADKAFQQSLFQSAEAFLSDLDAIKAGTLPAPVLSLASPDIVKLHALKCASVEAAKALDALDEEIKTLAQKILSENGATQVQGEGINIQLVEREGSVDYKKIPELKNVDLNQYRKKGTTYVKVNLNKQ